MKHFNHEKDNDWRDSRMSPEDRILYEMELQMIITLAKEHAEREREERLPSRNYITTQGYIAGHSGTRKEVLDYIQLLVGYGQLLPNYKNNDTNHEKDN
jgi:hypothetical protein